MRCVPRIVRSAYLDTNVFVEAAFLGKLHPSSAQVVDLAIARRIHSYGSALLRREVQGVCDSYGSTKPFDLYEASIKWQAPCGKEAKSLGRLYAQELRIKPNDALHLAMAVGARVDVFVSWNREDLVRPRTTDGLHLINQRIGRQTPSILTPGRLLASGGPSGRRGRLTIR